MTREPPKSPTGPGMRESEADESADEVKGAVQLVLPGTVRGRRNGQSRELWTETSGIYVTGNNREVSRMRTIGNRNGYSSVQ